MAELAEIVKLAERPFIVKGKDVTKESIKAAMKAATSESFGYNEDQICLLYTSQHPEVRCLLWNFEVKPLRHRFAMPPHGLRHPASAAFRLRIAGRGPNSDSLFPPLAAVVAVALSRGG